jgi:hypothetical protein
LERGRAEGVPSLLDDLKEVYRLFSESDDKREARFFVYEGRMKRNWADYEGLE